MPENKQASYEPMTFDKIKIGLASPEKIREWSHRTPEPEDKSSEAYQRWLQEGNVTKPETINYRTVFSVKRFSDLARIGSVIVVSIRR